MTRKCLSGAQGEISKVCFNPQGTKLITASSDKTCHIWSTETGECLQVRTGPDELLP